MLKLCFRKLLDLSKEVLLVSVDQRATKLRSIKLWVWSCRLGVKPGPPVCGLTLAESPTLTAHNFAAIWSTETHSTSLERSKPLLQTKNQFKGLAWFWREVLLSQSDPTYIGLMYLGYLSFFLWLRVQKSSKSKLNIECLVAMKIHYSAEV